MNDSEKLKTLYRLFDNYMDGLLYEKEYVTRVHDLLVSWGEREGRDRHGAQPAPPASESGS